MRGRAGLLLALALAALRAGAGKKAKKAKGSVGKVLTLTGELGDEETPNFALLTEARAIVVVGFIVDCLAEAEPGMAPDTLRQCEESRVLKPIFRPLAKRHTSITYAYVDIEAEEELARKFGVDSVPSVMLFRNGSEPARYSGSLAEEGIEGWVASESRLRQVGSKIELEKAVKARAKDAVLVAATGPPQVGQFLAETACSVSAGGANPGVEFVFWDSGGGGSFTLDLYRGVSEKAQIEQVPEKEYWAEDFTEFVLRERVPGFGALSALNAETVLANGAAGIVAVCFTPGTELSEAKRHAAMFGRVSAKRKETRFVFLDPSRGPLPPSAPSCTGVEELVFWRPAARGRPAYEKRTPFEAFGDGLTGKSVASFLKSALKTPETAEHGEL